MTPRQAFRALTPQGRTINLLNANPIASDDILTMACRARQKAEENEVITDTIFKVGAFAAAIVIFSPGLGNFNDTAATKLLGEAAYATIALSTITMILARINTKAWQKVENYAHEMQLARKNDDINISKPGRRLPPLMIS